MSSPGSFHDLVVISCTRFRMCEVYHPPNWIAPIGPDLDAFEEEVSHWTRMPFAVRLSIETAALYLALVILGIGPGDEVLVPSLSFVPTANAALYD